MDANQRAVLDKAILSGDEDKFQAYLRQGKSLPSFNTRIIDLNLATLRDIDDETETSNTKVLKVSFPWTSVFVVSATDGATINLRMDTKDPVQGDLILGAKDSYVFPYPVTTSYIHYAAQAGKIMKLLFLVRGEVKPGNFLVNVVATNEGTSVASSAKVPVLATPTLILPVNLNRKSATAQLQTSSSASAFIGDSVVEVESGSKSGIEIAPGGLVTWKNTAALYAIAVAAGTSTFNILEEA